MGMFVPNPPTVMTQEEHDKIQKDSRKFVKKRRERDIASGRTKEAARRRALDHRKRRNRPAERGLSLGGAGGSGLRLQ